MTLLAGVLRAALSLHRPERDSRRHADRGTHARGGRRADRLLRQHPGDASGHARPTRVLTICWRRSVRPRWELYPPGAAVRETGGRTQVPTRPEPNRHCFRSCSSCRMRRWGARLPEPDIQVHRIGTWNGEVRSHLESLGNTDGVSADSSSTTPTCSTRRPSSGWPGTSRRCSKDRRHPERRLCELPLLSDAERPDARRAGTHRDAEYPREATIARSSRRRSHARRTPWRSSAGDEQWTYDELNRRANRLAHHCVSLGVGAETAVGVFMHRTLDMVVRCWPCSSAVPCTFRWIPSIRTQRLRLPGQGRRRGRALAAWTSPPGFLGAEVRVVALESSMAIAGRSRPTRRAARTRLTRVRRLHVGLDGHPEGRRGAAPRRAAAAVRRRVSPSSARQTVIPHLSSPTFDASTFEMWAPLLHGGRCGPHPDRVPIATAPGDGDSARRPDDDVADGRALFNTVVDEDPALLTGLISS